MESPLPEARLPEPDPADTPEVAEVPTEVPTEVPAERPLPPGPPVPRFRPFGHLSQFEADSLGMLERGVREHGDICRFRFGPVHGMLLARPEYVQHALLARADTYDKRLLSYDMLRKILGNGLLTSEGEFWRRQRRIAQPAFHRGRLQGFVTIMVEEALKTAQTWDEAARNGRIVDVHRDMMRLALQVVSRSLLGADLADDVGRIGQGLDVSLEHLQHLMHHPFYPPDWVPTPRNLRFSRHRKSLERLVDGIIGERRRSGEVHHDLLAMLMEARDEETGEGMTDAQLRDEVMTLLLAGHETTANALTFTFHLLAHHPEALARLRQELDAELGGEPPDFDSMGRLAFTRQVVDESLRLYPPVWVVERRAGHDDVIGGYHVPAGSVLFVSAWITQRHPEVWPEPERFLPERFAPEAVRGRHRYAHFPFGGGPRVCIGATFALVEARLALAILASRFELEPVEAPGQDPRDWTRLQLDPGVTLRPVHGLPMRIRRR